MKINGSKFHLLLGLADWGRCLDSDEPSALTLAQWWPPNTPALPNTLPVWDRARDEVTIASLPIELPVTPGEAALALDARRAAAADRFGNIYRVGSDRTTLRVFSRGSGVESDFWPSDALDCEGAHRSVHADFTTQDVSNEQAATFHALTVTEDHYLVVAFSRSNERGLLAFDLAAGGPPMPTLWPAELPFAPFDMTSRCGGGAWLLDRANGRLWELDRRLSIVGASVAASSAEDDFQPLDGSVKTRPERRVPQGIDLRAAPILVNDPIAVEYLGCGRVLLLDRDLATSRTRLIRVHRDGDSVNARRSDWYDFLAHDFAVGTAHLRVSDGERRRSVFLALPTGNQATAFALDDDSAPFNPRRHVELFPMRRFGGRALVTARSFVHYDSGFESMRWVPLAQQPRARFDSHAELVTAVMDAREPQTVWDRALLDASIPADTEIQIESRAGDEIFTDGDHPQVVASWRLEPAPILRRDGAELPWLRNDAIRETRRPSGIGTWETLLQSARGRYLQLRIRLRSGAGTATPRLRALRVWYPRFSYVQRFLPAVYREDPAAGNFLERWLANFEGTLSGVESRIAQAQALFDPRTAPSDALAWLAEWFDVAFDPSWDEPRRRLFIRHAMEFFRWRGTPYGLRLALELAFHPCVDQRWFAGPQVDAARPQAIRIVESFQTRLIGALAAGDPGAADGAGLRELRLTSLWEPAEGNAGLADRFARFAGRPTGATPQEQVEPFALVERPADFWRANLGFVPTLGADERARWGNFARARQIDARALPRDWPESTALQSAWKAFVAQGEGARIRSLWSDFLARRYRRVSRFQDAWGVQWPEFSLVPLPDVLPDTTAAQRDWLQFERQLLAVHRAAHRFSVLLPVAGVTESPEVLDERRRMALRIVELEKPAHTAFDVRFYWALNRLGEARLGLDTLLGQGSRAPELIPDAELGRAYIGASFVAGGSRSTQPTHDSDRLLAQC